MNARGIPTAAYQVLHLLSCTGKGATPAGRVPHLGYPPLDLARGGTPSLLGGYPTSSSPPSDLAEGAPHLRSPSIRPCQGVPHPCQGVSHLGYPLSDLVRGVPHPCQGVPNFRYLHLAGSGWGTPSPSWTWSGYPFPCGLTDRHVSKHNLPVVLLMGGSLAVVRSYALGCEPLVTGYLAMGLTIRSSHKQELSSVYQFIDVLYSLCIYEALRH